MASRRRARARPTAARWKRVLVGLAAVRFVLGLVAIPLAPILYREHYLVLVLLRPTKEVLLFGGFLARRNDVHLLQIVAAAVPLVLFGVWLSFALGRTHRHEIKAGRVPGIGSHLLPVEKIKRLSAALRKKGPRLILLGRLAVFPSALLGSAAGSSSMKPETFLRVDALGAALSIAEALGIGYLLGSAYEKGRGWVLAVGLVGLAAFAVILGRALRRE